MTGKLACVRRKNRAAMRGVLVTQGRRCRRNATGALLSKPGRIARQSRPPKDDSPSLRNTKKTSSQPSVDSAVRFEAGVFFLVLQLPGLGGSTGRCATPRNIAGASGVIAPGGRRLCEKAVHMNALLAEGEVALGEVFGMEDTCSEFSQTSRCFLP